MSDSANKLNSVPQFGICTFLVSVVLLCTTVLFTSGFNLVRRIESALKYPLISKNFMVSVAAPLSLLHDAIPSNTIKPVIRNANFLFNGLYQYITTHFFGNIHT